MKVNNLANMRSNMNGGPYANWKTATSPQQRNKTSQGFKRNRWKALSESLDLTAETFRAVQNPTPLSPVVGKSLLNKSINYADKTKTATVTPITSEYVLKPTNSLMEPKMR